MNKFKCNSCGTTYMSENKEPPPGINWSDGHVCNPQPIETIYETFKSKL